MSERIPTRMVIKTEKIGEAVVFEVFGQYADGGYWSVGPRFIRERKAQKLARVVAAACGGVPVAGPEGV